MSINSTNPPGAPPPGPTSIDTFLSNLYFNIGAASVCLTAFTILSSRVSWCYTPRLHNKNAGKTRVEVPPHVQLGFCRFSWVLQIFRIEESDLLAMTGVDGAVYIRFFQLGVKFFSTVSLVAMVLLAIDGLLGNADLNLGGFDRYTISNLEAGSDLLYVHLVAAYIFTIFLLYLLWREFNFYIRIRRRYYLTNTEETLDARLSVLVQDIPSDLRKEETFSDFFRNLYPHSFRSSTLAYDTRYVDKLISKREKSYRKWEHDTYILMEKKRNLELGKNNSTSKTEDSFLRKWFAKSEKKEKGKKNCCCVFSCFQHKSNDESEERSDNEKSSILSKMNSSCCRRICFKCFPEVEKGRNDKKNPKEAKMKCKCCLKLCFRCWSNGASKDDDTTDAQKVKPGSFCCLLRCRICEPTINDEEKALESRKLGYWCFKCAPGKGNKNEKNEEIKRPTLRPKWCGKNVDAIHYRSNQIEELNAKISGVAMSESLKCNPSGFITFYTFEAVSVASQIKQGNKVFQLSVRLAPEPDDMIWENLRFNYRDRKFRSIISNTLIFLLVVFWTVPVAFAASLSTLTNLVQIFPFLKPLLELAPSVAAFLEGFLPGLALIIFMAILPIICESISNKVKGVEAQSWVEKDVLVSFFYFQLFNFFLATTIAGAFLEVAQDIIDNPASIVMLLSESLPAQASTFLSYVMLRTFFQFPVDLIRIVPLVLGSLKLKYFAATEFERTQVTLPDTINYGTEYPMHLLIWIIGLTYAPISPYLVPFIALYFVFGTLIARYKLLYLCAPRYESGGAFFPLVFNRIMVGCIVCHLTLIGVFSLKEGYIESTLMLVIFVIAIVFWKFVNDNLATSADRLTRQETAKMDKVLEDTEFGREEVESVYVSPCKISEEIDVRAQKLDVQSQVISHSSDPINIEFEQVEAEIVEESEEDDENQNIGKDE